MSLTTGRGPLGRQPAGYFSAPVPPDLIYVEPFPRRVRAVRADRVVVDSERAMLVHRPGEPPSYAFPADDVLADLADPEPAATGFVRVPWHYVDAWYEETEQVHLHPRNPYHRIDCVRTERRLVVRLDGEVLVDATHTMGVYETSSATRLYVDKSLIRMDRLRPSSTTTYCPYKGTASFFSAVGTDGVIADVAWCYEDPTPESLPIRGLLCFDGRRVDVEQDVP
jgi:uncharacterized protein (DUF427 family)